MRPSLTCSALTAGEIFLPLHLPRDSGMWKKNWEVWLPVKTDANNSPSTSVFSTCVEGTCLFSFIRGGTLFFPDQYTYRIFFLLFTLPCFLFALTLLISPLHIWMTSLFSSQVTHPCFHFLSFSLIRRYPLSHASLLPSLLDFRWMESYGALKNAAFKKCQHCSTPSSIRTASLNISGYKTLVMKSQF